MNKCLAIFFLANAVIYDLDELSQFRFHCSKFLFKIVSFSFIELCFLTIEICK